ncbi:hypothetical protein BLNAU_15632 [Blattamonas nauphoetae]|uniref:Uncharacterized protein n=1 Tax=Blattamonas nauphoetae TaxID=2049346 RepID=A0ABQ9XGM5_9EUKA|nr:hypothetical protein BLNAU_15632 [Blattamonas nauphoetae]
MADESTSSSEGIVEFEPLHIIRMTTRSHALPESIMFTFHLNYLLFSLTIHTPNLTTNHHSLPLCHPVCLTKLLFQPLDLPTKELAIRETDIQNDRALHLESPPQQEDLIHPLVELVGSSPPQNLPLPTIKLETRRRGQSVQLTMTEPEVLVDFVGSLEDMQIVREKRVKKQKVQKTKVNEVPKKKANKRGRPKLEESWESDDETSIEVTSWSGSEESVEEEVKKVKRQTSAVTEDSDSCSSYSVSEELRTTSIITRSRASPELICHKTPVMVDDDSLEEDLDIPPPLHQTESSSPSNSEAEPAPSLDVGYDSDLATSSRCIAGRVGMTFI